MHPELSEVQSRLERMRLEGSPLLDSSSSGGEGSSTVGSGHGKRKLKPSQKKSRSSSSLGYAESRYFIMKSLNEEDLKLSAQHGLWATQEHLVPILNDAFMVCTFETGCMNKITNAHRNGMKIGLYIHCVLYLFALLLLFILIFFGELELQERLSHFQCQQERGVLWLCSVSHIYMYYADISSFTRPEGHRF